MAKSEKTKNLTFKEGAGVVILVIVSLFVISYFNAHNSEPYRDRDKARAIGHATQIKLALTEFEDKYGLRPGDETAKLIPGAKSKTANDCFRQLIQGAAKFRYEVFFHAPTSFTSKPDADIGSESNHYAQGCAPGEVGFLYIDAPYATSSAPLIAAPLTEDMSRFDYKRYNGKAVILKVDGSVATPDIDKKTGRIYIEVDGKKIDMFSKENPAFGKEFSIKYPEHRKDR